MVSAMGRQICLNGNYTLSTLFINSKKYYNMEKKVTKQVDNSAQKTAEVKKETPENVEEATQDTTQEEVKEPEATNEENKTAEVKKETKKEQKLNYKCPDGSIFDREDLAIDWCKMRKLDLNEIEKCK